MDPVPSPRNSKSPLSTGSGISRPMDEKRPVTDEFTKIEPSEIQWGEQIGTPTRRGFQRILKMMVFLKKKKGGGAYGTVHKAKVRGKGMHSSVNDSPFHSTKSRGGCEAAASQGGSIFFGERHQSF